MLPLPSSFLFSTRFFTPKAIAVPAIVQIANMNTSIRVIANFPFWVRQSKNLSFCSSHSTLGGDVLLLRATVALSPRTRTGVAEDGTSSSCEVGRKSPCPSRRALRFLFMIFWLLVMGVWSETDE